MKSGLFFARFWMNSFPFPQPWYIARFQNYVFKFENITVETENKTAEYVVISGIVD